MAEHDPNKMSNAGSGSDNRQRNASRSVETDRPVNRPYGDAGNLYEIPSIRPDDPPMRKWWTDDEPQQNGSGSPEND